MKPARYNRAAALKEGQYIGEVMDGGRKGTRYEDPTQHPFTAAIDNPKYCHYCDQEREPHVSAEIQERWDLTETPIAPIEVQALIDKEDE